MVINPNTKIAAILKTHPAALETIVNISPKFKKLRNPVLRKVVAGRTSIAMASKLAGCNAEDFFIQLEPLGFLIDRSTPVEAERDNINGQLPAFIKNTPEENITVLDVRPVIESGKDPLTIILREIKSLTEERVLKIVNSFEPTPLMHLLHKQGFDSFAEVINEDLVYTYFYKNKAGSFLSEEVKTDEKKSWDEIAAFYQDRLESVDVRNLQMPLPMHTILNSLDSLPGQKALMVYHKRIPVFLLPELESRGFSYRIKEVSENEVHMLIFKP